MRPPLFSTKTLSLIIMITAINLVSNYAMLWIPNVKFMDLLVFVSGYIMGAVPGAIVGILTWLVYGTLNPRGFNLPTFVATCVGECLYGIVGGLSAKFGLGSELSSMNAGDGRIWLVNLKFGVVGFFLTFIYDLFTNIVTGIVFGIPFMIVILQGIPFALAHEISNFFFFFFGCNLLVNVIKKLTFMGGGKI